MSTNYLVKVFLSDRFPHIIFWRDFYPRLIDKFFSVPTSVLIGNTGRVGKILQYLQRLLLIMFMNSNHRIFEEFQLNKYALPELVSVALQIQVEINFAYTISGRNESTCFLEAQLWTIL